MTVPWEIASWGPRVHTLAAESLSGARSLDALGDGGDVQGLQDRRDIVAALENAGRRGLAYASENRYDPAAFDKVLEARVALASGQLDQALSSFEQADTLARSHRVERLTGQAVLESFADGREEAGAVIGERPVWSAAAARDASASASGLTPAAQAALDAAGHAHADGAIRSATERGGHAISSAQSTPATMQHGITQVRGRTLRR